MYARDANNATWYMLRYAGDFVPGAVGGTPGPGPLLGKELFYDHQRHVLELRPAKPAGEAEPPPGLAVDPDGAVYFVDPETGTLLVRRCDGSVEELPVDCGVFAAPAGLALDRRGYLYVADPAAGRVIVLLPEDGSLIGVIADPLVEPVDVAIAPDGRVYVADRAADQIAVFNSRLEPCGTFPPRNGDGFPAAPRPIAVMIGDDGAVVVADAEYPRLLRFGPKGEPLADADVAAFARAADADGVALDALAKAYGREAPQFVPGTCRPPRPSRDGGEALARVHRDLRARLLHLDAQFEACGTFVSAILDGGSPGIEWHKIEIDADLPAGTWLKVQAVTSDDAGDLDDPDALLGGARFEPFEDPSCAVKPLAPSGILDRLIQSPPGRYLRVRLSLGGNGHATPRVRAIRILYPRVSYLDLLPRVYRRDGDSALFLERYLALFERIFTRVEDRYERFSRELNPDAAPREVIDWLATLIDLAFDPSWPLSRRRALVAAAMELYRTRGTVKGIERYVEIYTGVRPLIIEAFKERSARPPYLGVAGAILGFNTGLAQLARYERIEETTMRRHAHRFKVLVYLTDGCDERVMLSAVDRIVEVNKPAHTVHALSAIRPDAQVGSTQIGIDLLLGARDPGRTQVGGCFEPGVPPGPPAVLGVDSILGAERPGYARPAETRL